MRGQPQGYHRSVDRGTCRLGIELRNNRDQSADVVPYGGRQYRRMRYRKCPPDAAQSKTPGMHGNSTRENRETQSTPAGKDAAGRLEKALSQKSNMYVDGESDGRIVPAKCPNKGEQASAEGMEGRRPTKENIGQATPPRTQSRTRELSDLHGVREAARRDNSPSPSQPALQRQASEVTAVCSNSARTDPCGGRRATGVPTATKPLGSVGILVEKA